jgi:hypothetical protein
MENEKRNRLRRALYKFIQSTPTNTNYYAGIGSRQTPPEVMEIMTSVSYWLSSLDYTLRSGGAKGADTAFERGSSKSDIFLPWKGFNGNTGPLHPLTELHTQIAKEHHPIWDRLTPPVQKMHSRNVAQVLGLDCKTPSDFVLCYTPNGSGSGGTGQALRIAKNYNIPIFDMGKYYI